MESILSFGGVCRFTTNFRNWRKKIRDVRKCRKLERESQVEEKRSHENDHGDEVKRLKLEPRCVCG